jgi:maleamate amidohydrolase
VSYGALPVEFGKHPPNLVVDCQEGFTDPAGTMGKSPRVHARRGLALHTRRCNIPIASCYTAYHSERDGPLWKVAAVRCFIEDTREAEMDDLIVDPIYNYILRETAPSISMRMPLTGYPTRHCVDAVRAIGCVCSGCVRVSVIDSFSSNYPARS